MNGFSFFHYNEKNIFDYSFWVVDEWDVLFGFISELKKEKLQGKIICALRHHLDYSGRDLPSAHFSIRAHKCIAAPSDAFVNVITKDNLDLFKQATTFPVHSKIEFAYTGPYHIAEWTKKREHQKKEFRAELEETIARKLPEDKPVIAFFKDELTYEKSIIHGLKKLSKHATVIYKPFEENDPCILALGKHVTLWPSINYAPNLLRFASDFIFAGYSSGTLSSSIMLGLKVLPYYTEQVYIKGRAAKELGSYKTFMPRPPYTHTNARCLAGYGEFFDLENTANILKAINSENFWNSYSKRLPEIQKIAFGDYTLEDPEIKTSKLILRAFIKGSFGMDASIIKIKE
ncbi:hypothetical protein [Desulfovibrio sp. UCD-KL4C]|uniref:hypothetical protein n=1 Tax=Desulfovibrio sp. UCD-KL4C TaxID=2578120 RepID=UPI0025C06C1E|nr:hypothetical protein [Desulfovibrio sp. UCD-KL4C]